MSGHVVLLHGAATTAAVYGATRLALPDTVTVHAPQRTYSGDLETELGPLRDLCAGAVVAGVSGGATLGLALALEGVDAVAWLLHEPAVGSLAPGLLAPMRTAWETYGVEGFGKALYGPVWNRSMAPADPDTVGRDLDMFASFDPPWSPLTTVDTSVGSRSPQPRHHAAQALAEATGARVTLHEGVGHALHLEAPQTFAAWITSYLQEDCPQGQTSRRSACHNRGHE